MRDTLPRHPVTGLRALGFRKDGRAIFPILGADTRGDEATVRALAEIDAEIERVRSALVEFADVEDMDDTASQRFAGLETELTELESRREPIAHRAEVIARVRAAQSSNRGTERAGDRGPEVMHRTQPFADLDAVSSRSLSVTDLQSRALAAVEQAGAGIVSDDSRERAESLLRNNDRHGRIARHMLLTGSDDYSRAFEELLTGVQPWQLPAELQRALSLADAQHRAINEGSNSAGGFLVPFYLDPTIILTNAGSANPFRAMSRVETISTNKWHGVSTSGVTASYRGEAQETTDASPTFGQPEVDVVKADAYLQASFESMQDTNVVASFGGLLADAKDNFEAREMAVGDGAAGHMQGVLTGLAASPGSIVQTATAGTLTVDDVYACHDELGDRWLENAAWVAHRRIYSKIRQFATGTGQNTGAFWATLGGGLPAELLGSPIRRASGMDSTVATGKNVLAHGDFKRGFLVVDRIGMAVQYEPLVKGPNRRPTGEAGWYAYWRVGSGVIVPDAFRLLQVK